MRIVSIIPAIALGLWLTHTSYEAPTENSSDKENPSSAPSVIGSSSLSITPIRPDLSRRQLQITPAKQNSFLLDMDGKVGRDETALDNRAAVAFDNFAVKVKLKEDELDVGGAFTLGASSDGINLFKEEVAVKLGTFATTIKAGSFKRKTTGKVSFKKVIDCTYWEVEFRPLGKNIFEFKAQLLGVKESTKMSPEDVALSIGDDGGPARAAQ